MKILIILSMMFHLSLSLSANGGYKSYMDMKQKAYKFYDKKEEAKAFWVVNDYIKKHKKSLRAKNLLAVLYFWSGDIERSKNQLNKILRKSRFPQSVALLRKINESSSQRTTSNKRVKGISKSELRYLSNRVKKRPNDALSRKILALHYKRVGDTKKSKYFAMESLKINPDDREMLSMISGERNKKTYANSTVSNALKKLDYFYNKKDYDRFINLYSSMENNSIMIPTSTHVKALECAIAIQDYEKAKSIMLFYRMPNSKYISEIEKLIDEKILLSRFAQSCTSGYCTVSR